MGGQHFAENPDHLHIPVKPEKVVHAGFDARAKRRPPGR